MDLILTASVNLPEPPVSSCSCIHGETNVQISVRNVDDQLWVVVLAAEPRGVVRATMERLERVRGVLRVQRIQRAHLAGVDVAEERVPLGVLHLVFVLVIMVVAAVVVLVVVTTRLHSASRLSKCEVAWLTCSDQI